MEIPKGPKLEKIQDLPPGLKISSEIEIFKRATPQGPTFCGNAEGRDFNTKEYLNQRETLYRSFPGVRKGG